MRTRSQPVSPGGLVSLDDVPPRRRRTTRSASAQPQEAESAKRAESVGAEATKPKSARKPRKAGGKSTRGKKASKQVSLEGLFANNASQKTTGRRQTPTPGPEHQDAASTAAEHSEEAVSGEPRGHPDHDMEDAAPTVDGPLTIIPSVEVSVPEVESEFDIVSTSDPQLRDHSPVNPNETTIPLDRESQSGPASIVGMIRNPRQWFAGTLPGLTSIGLTSTGLRSIGLTSIGVPSIGLSSIGLSSIGLKARRLPSINIWAPRNEPATSLLDEIQMLTIRPVRNMLRRNPRTSPPRRLPVVAPTPSPNAKRATGDSDVLKPRQATPIRRSRSSYSIISQNRRTEASGRIGRTLYRLSDLVSQNQSTRTSPEPEALQNAQTEEIVIADPPVTPKTHPPTTPMTAPAAAPADGPEGSPSLPRWIYNNISRKWTSLRERWGTRTAATNDDSMDAEQVTAPSSPIAQSTPPIETAPSATPAQITAPPPEEVVPWPRTSFRPLRRASLHIPHHTGPRRPRRRRTSTTQVAAPARPKPAPERPAKLPYDLFPAGFSEELLDRCYAGSTRPRNPLLCRNRSAAQSVETAESLHAPPSQAPDTSISTEDHSLKRKREEPGTIPNPKGCSYGMDMDYFEFTEEEWAEEEKRQAELAAAKETAAPAAKKQRVEEPQQQRRRVASSALSPARRPGFVPNRRGTYQAPDLPTIDSSRLMSDVVSSPAAPVVDRVPRTPHVAQTPKPATVAPQAKASDASVGGLAQTPSPVRRARTKAEQFKPKTPSRLRESHHLSSSQSSTSSGLAKTPVLLSDPMSIDTSLGHVVIADDVNWLHELCPAGGLEELPWPDRVGIGESLGVDPSPVSLVNRVWNPEMARESSAAWQSVFQNS